MTHVFRLGLGRIVPTSTKSLLSSSKQICIIQKCNISGKTLRGYERQKLKPYPYKTKGYGFLNSIYDKTTNRFDENTKVIIVEGPIAAGKTQLAQKLADELEMQYIPEANMDTIYINPYGYDMRQLDPQLPEAVRSYDIKNFCKDPKHQNAANFQIQMFMLRFMQYFDALAHLLNTGQGVILDRSPYSDFVFMEAMVKSGYVSKQAKSVYYDIRNNVLDELLYPHLVLYLDIPVNVVKERITKRGLEHEKNCKALTDQYLENIELEYKQSFLKQMSAHSELLVYDWTSFGDIEVVVEDIERIDFERFDTQETQMRDWRFGKEWAWACARMKYTNDKQKIMSMFGVPRYDVPELTVDPYDAKKYREVWLNAPGMKFRYGYNSDMGDTGIITKTSSESVLSYSK